ncbi:MAG: type II/IV secretion system ATPase subunit [Nitrososphaerota archaeon]|jgi:flagellar protein FlaI|nr:type II/IV secretion system ATPase subunit [Nitrososphaerota archaeon]MDG6900203.1 type II/IV secretion system ATPase subunit [Nitrososphaerota archaeon]MDG6912994.1 type II/IV secretion system ATPase subunit [Nitrososphaerota archaeon]MDG6921223.1 type II/IV secretion system ATPase subunit [Nitrososphaerota archaeon]MDG6937828.1 type II/IV secretion system ATPase subunit [Nitrososphaerota archaeon]
MFGSKKDPTKDSKDAKGPAIRYPPMGAPVPPSWKEVERYALNAPFAYAVIAEDPATTTKKYFIDEVSLTPREGQIYTYILDTLESELTVPRGEIDPKSYFRDQAKRIVVKYGIKASQLAWPKILYFAERDLVGFGILDGLMRDVNIEDISADGLKKPIFVYQRKYESIETNISFADDVPLDNLISRLAHMAGKHISTAFPIVQGTLPGRHRLSATFRREVSPFGGSFTVRKFREDPVTITDLINMNVIDQNIAAYVWLLMENRSPALVVGSTGSGKTTLMNALLTFTRMNNKIVTIEEVQEANLPHSNWTALLSRESYGVVEDSGREIGLFDLVKTAMRMRPDILVVGEVRGEEAYVLFQGLATGHGGISTVHADDVSSAIQRLTSKPMDVPPAFIPFLDLVFTVRRIAIPTPDGGFRNVRRVLSVDEVVSVGNYVKMFRWDPATDKHVPSPLKNSVKLARLAKDLGMTHAELADEVGRRASVLKWIQQRGIRNFREVSSILEEYRTDPKGMTERAFKELGLIRVTTEGEA